MTLALWQLAGYFGNDGQQDHARGKRLAVQNSYFEFADSVAASQVWRTQWIAIRSVWRF